MIHRRIIEDSFADEVTRTAANLGFKTDVAFEASIPMRKRLILMRCHNPRTDKRLGINLLLYRSQANIANAKTTPGIDLPGCVLMLSYREGYKLNNDGSVTPDGNAPRHRIIITPKNWDRLQEKILYLQRFEQIDPKGDDALIYYALAGKKDRKGIYLNDADAYLNFNRQLGLSFIHDIELIDKMYLKPGIDQEWGAATLYAPVHNGKPYIPKNVDLRRLTLYNHDYKDELKLANLDGIKSNISSLAKLVTQRLWCDWGYIVNELCPRLALLTINVARDSGPAVAETKFTRPLESITLGNINNPAGLRPEDLAKLDLENMSCKSFILDTKLGWKDWINAAKDGTLSFKNIPKTSSITLSRGDSSGSAEFMAELTLVDGNKENSALTSGLSDIDALF